MKRVLIVGNIDSSLVLSLALELNKSGKISADIFDTEFNTLYTAAQLPGIDIQQLVQIRKNRTVRTKKINILFSIVHLYGILLSAGYTHLHLTYITRYYSLFLPYLWISNIKVILSIFGNDFTDASKSSLAFLQLLFNRSSVIAFTSSSYASRFDGYYHQQYSTKIRICRFGLTALQDIDAARQADREMYRTYFNIPASKLVIVCGTYGEKDNNQKAMLGQLIKLPAAISQGLHLIIPYTYGGTVNGLEEIRTILAKSDYSSTILTSFMNFSDLAKLRLVTDILIHLPVVDQFSGAMLETLYAGGTLVTGTWLNYPLLDELDAKYVKVASFEELNPAIIPLLDNTGLTAVEKEKNKTIVAQLCAWENQTPKWLELYNS